MALVGEPHHILHAYKLVHGLSLFNQTSRLSLKVDPKASHASIHLPVVRALAARSSGFLQLVFLPPQPTIKMASQSADATDSMTGFLAETKPADDEKPRTGFVDLPQELRDHVSDGSDSRVVHLR